MTPRHRYTFYIDDDERSALAAIKERDGISESEQIRRAVKAWVALKNVTVSRKATPKRRPARKRS